MTLSILALFLTCIALPWSGVAMQRVFKNQLGDIYSLGLGSAACLGGAIAAYFGVHPSSVALLCCLATTFIASIAACRFPIKTLIVFGMLLGSVIGAFGTIAANNADPEDLSLYYRWSSCTFDVSEVPLVTLICCITLFITGSAKLTKFSMNSAPANIFAAHMLATSVLPLVGFVGIISLLIPNLVRLLYKNTISYKKEVIVSVLIGGALLTITFIVQSCFVDKIYLPISATMSLLSSPLLAIVFLSKS